MKNYLLPTILSLLLLGTTTPQAAVTAVELTPVGCDHLKDYLRHDVMVASIKAKWPEAVLALSQVSTFSWDDSGRKMEVYYFPDTANDGKDARMITTIVIRTKNSFGAWTVYASSLTCIPTDNPIQWPAQ